MVWDWEVGRGGRMEEDVEAKDWDWEDGIGFRRGCCEGCCCEAGGC